MKRTYGFVLIAGVSPAALASLVLGVPGDSSAYGGSASGVTLKQLVDHWSVLQPMPVTP